MKPLLAKQLKDQKTVTVLKGLCILFITLTAPAGLDAFDKSRLIDSKCFADPPREYRQHAWLTYNLSRATEEQLTGQIRHWAEQDLTGGFYLRNI
jgi:hypothetical protein